MAPPGVNAQIDAAGECTSRALAQNKPREPKIQPIKSDSSKIIGVILPIYISVAYLLMDGNWALEKYVGYKN